MVATVLEPDLEVSISRRARGPAAPLTLRPAPALPGFADDLPSRLHFWRGLSGERHIFSVYSLIECPPLQPVTYLLVRRGADGRRDILASGTLEAEHAPLNLATVRYQGACLGANEVHVAASSTDASARAALAAEFPAPVR